MPWRKLLSFSSLPADDIALLEAIFNQTSNRFASEEERHTLSQNLVALFSTGAREEAELIRRLAKYLPSVEKAPVRKLGHRKALMQKKAGAGAG